MKILCIVFDVLVGTPWLASFSATAAVDDLKTAASNNQNMVTLVGQTVSVQG